MTKFGLYLVCNEYINEVRDFLKSFFDEKVDEYSFEGWATFEIPSNNLVVNLMKDDKRSITQNMTFEIYCDSLEELSLLAKKYGTRVNSFLATDSLQHYKYHYTEIVGPKNICKVEISYSKDIK